MHGSRHNRYLCYLRNLLLVAVAGLALTSHAALYPAKPAGGGNTQQAFFNWFWDPGRPNRANMGYGTTGVNAQAKPPTVAPGVTQPTVNGQAAILIDSSGRPVFSSQTTLPVPGAASGSAPVAMNAAIDLASAAAALGSFAGKLSFPLNVAMTGYSLVKLAQEFKYDGLMKQNGNIFVIRNSEGDGFQCEDPGYWPSPYLGDPSIQHVKYCVPSSPGSDVMVYGYSLVAPAYGWPGVNFPCGDSSCPSGYVDQRIGTTTRKKVVTVDQFPLQKLLDEIRDLKKYPPNSAITNALKEAIDSGEQVEMGKPELSGPASVPGKPVTTTNPDGTTSTSVTDPTLTYDGDAVETGETTQECTTGADGTSSCTTTTDPDPEKPAEDECVKYPDRLGCAEMDTPTGQIPREEKTVNYTPEAFSWGASASCPPPWSFQAPVIGTTYAISYQPFCDVADRIRPFILAGAAFVAMMIVGAGIKA